MQIADYRAHWGNPTLPFGAVFLAAWQADTPYFPQMRLSVGESRLQLLATARSTAALA